MGSEEAVTAHADEPLNAVLPKARAILESFEAHTGARDQRTCPTKWPPEDDSAPPGAGTHPAVRRYVPLSAHTDDRSRVCELPWIKALRSTFRLGPSSRRRCRPVR